MAAGINAQEKKIGLPSPDMERHGNVMKAFGRPRMGGMRNQPSGRTQDSRFCAEQAGLYTLCHNGSWSLPI